MNRVMAMVVAMAVLVTAATVQAAELATPHDLPPLTPKNHPRIMTTRDETSTSKCIGRMITPLCAVETKIACFLRGDTRLCDMVGGHLSGAPGNAPPWSMRYLISRAVIIDDRHFPWPPSTDKGQPAGVPSVRAGDVRIDVRQMYCFSGDAQNCEPSYDFPITYVVRKENAQWQLIGWASEVRWDR